MATDEKIILCGSHELKTDFLKILKNEIFFVFFFF